MRRYETVVVLAAELGEAKLKEETARLQSLIEGFGGKNVNADRWGTREVGYRMQKPVIGQYVCFAYDTENNATPESLGGTLRITDSVLKFQTHRIHEKTRKFKGYAVRKDGEFGADADDVGGY